jgi:hypothetical protein
MVAHPSSGQTLLEQAAAVDKLVRPPAKNFQQGVNLCNIVGNWYENAVTSETDPIVQEYYLQVRAEAHRGLASIRDGAAQKEELGKTLDCFADYFDWLAQLSTTQRTTVLSKRANKVSAAAAAYGDIAAELDQPKRAYEQYEQLEPEYFGPQAMNLWLWALLHPEYHPPIHNVIFGCDDAVLKSYLKNPDLTPHWEAFRESLDKIIKLPHLGCHEKFKSRLQAAWASSGSSAKR